MRTLLAKLTIINGFLLPLVILLGSAMISLAQSDPGDQDSLIASSISWVPYRPGEWSTVYVDLDFVTDDSVIFFYIPLKWSSIDGRIFIGYVVWRDIVLLWDEYIDSLDLSERRLWLTGVCDLGGSRNPPLFTSGIRRNQIDLRIVIAPDAIPQEVVVDTVFDRPYNSLAFGLEQGIDFTPAFMKTSIRYFERSEVDDKGVYPIEWISCLANYPNPFNNYTIISFVIAEKTTIILELYDLAGRLVRTLHGGDLAAGKHSIIWDGRGDDHSPCASGIYSCKISSREVTRFHRLTLLR